MTGAEITTIIVALITNATLIVGFFAQRKQGSEIHTAVNSNLTTAQNRNEQLTAALTSAAIPVPRSAENEKLA